MGIKTFQAEGRVSVKAFRQEYVSKEKTKHQSVWNIWRKGESVERWSQEIDYEEILIKSRRKNIFKSLEIVQSIGQRKEQTTWQICFSVSSALSR